LYNIIVDQAMKIFLGYFGTIGVYPLFYSKGFHIILYESAKGVSYLSVELPYSKSLFDGGFLALTWDY